jgi:hypothetical protein
LVATAESDTHVGVTPALRLRQQNSVPPAVAVPALQSSNESVSLGTLDPVHENP